MECPAPNNHGLPPAPHLGPTATHGGPLPWSILSRNYEIHVAADFSKETKKHRKAFLSLLPRLCKLEVKYDLFEPARMWITKNEQSKDLRSYRPASLLDGLMATAMDLNPSILPSELLEDLLGTLSSCTPADGR
ncbi:hypothetical protein NDU88_002868 [Pleurodeles waltl]|nr:hypothetical protein NDU88_002868 [Pleurodeles waltl]